MLVLGLCRGYRHIYLLGKLNQQESTVEANKNIRKLF
jgi:hypothetical protein